MTTSPKIAIRVVRFPGNPTVFDPVTTSSTNIPTERDLVHHLRQTASEVNPNPIPLGSEPPYPVVVCTRFMIPSTPTPAQNPTVDSTFDPIG